MMGEIGMELLKATLESITEANKEMMEKAKEKVDSLCKPLGSLGKLEKIAIQLAGITEKLELNVSNKAVIALAADHGVYEENVSNNPQFVTVMQAIGFAKGFTGVCAIARAAGAKVVSVDVGIKEDLPESSGVINKKVRYGTANMAKGPAMSREEAIRAIEAGIEVANEQVKQGVNVLATGEMGICNTTASSAVLAALFKYDPAEVTGMGAGVDSLQHKIDVIRRAIEINKPDPEDPIDVLAKVGGLELGGMAGVVLGAAANRVPVVIDGFISTVSALIAYKLEPKVKDYIIPSHLSEEPGAKIASELLGVEPMLNMNMRLGEGSGAALAFPILDAACSMINTMTTLEQSGEYMQKVMADQIV